MTDAAVVTPRRQSPDEVLLGESRSQHTGPAGNFTLAHVSGPSPSGGVPEPVWKISGCERQRHPSDWVETDTRRERPMSEPVLAPILQTIRNLLGRHAVEPTTDAALLARFVARRDEAAF